MLLQVVVRVRPPLPRELQGFRPYEPATLADPSRRAITLSENLRAAANANVENGVVYNTYRFAFDRVYAPDTPQEEVYTDCARGAVSNVLQGYNASIVAFGQTGAGKTFTMTGDLAGPGRGIIPRAIEDVFSHIQRDTGEACKFLVRASYLQIYNEVISDLLKPGTQASLTIREDRRRGVHVEGLSEWVVRTPGDVYALMEKGGAARTTGATKLNELSSRSHAIFILIVEKSSVEGGATGDGGAAAAAAHLAGVDAGAGAGGVRQTVRVGKLNLVDLAGSERVHLTGATGKRLEESKKINQSLSALGNVIAALTDPRGRGVRPHVPYRDSKLTRILEDSLGGNCKTTFMALVSPAVEAFSESLSTLKFAHRAKCVRNAPVINEDLDHRTLLRKYERELKRLRAELAQRSKDLVDKRLVLQLEEARRREQADKIAAITALERQSGEIVRHKAAMAQLQSRIASMQSQLLVGGQELEETPQFRTLLAREQARIKQGYETRLAELEAERHKAAEGKAKVQQVLELLRRQQAVMQALTVRVGELDAEVMALQAGVEEAEGGRRELEDQLDRRTAEVIALRKAAATGIAPLDVGLVEGVGCAIGGKGAGGGSEELREDSDWTIPASPGADSGVTHGPLEVGAMDIAGSSDDGSSGSEAGGDTHRSAASNAVSRAASGAGSAAGSVASGAADLVIAAPGDSGHVSGAASGPAGSSGDGSSATAAGAAAAGIPEEQEGPVSARAASEEVAARCRALSRDRACLQRLMETQVMTAVTRVSQQAGALGQGEAAQEVAASMVRLEKLITNLVGALRAPPI